jgi:hypothetical protein
MIVSLFRFLSFISAISCLTFARITTMADDDNYEEKIANFYQQQQHELVDDSNNTIYERNSNGNLITTIKPQAIRGL